MKLCIARKKKRWGKIGQVAIKLDMSKAYNRVEWDYLKRVMEKMGFHAKWVQLIMACITTAHFSVIVNGNPTGYILPSRGLRQGDPLSPYLFLFCVEGLTALLRKAETEGIIRGVVARRGGPCISHLLFANESLLFCRALVKECQQVNSLLNLYEATSGQKVNTNKTSIFFSSNTSFETQESIKQLLGAETVLEYEKYLGLPCIVGRNKKVAFAPIIERV